MVTLRKFDTSQVVGGLAYDERTKARAHEIEALRRAQTILEDVFRARAAFLQTLLVPEGVAFLTVQN